jgi:Skp family chaperone for outer membrane proteins
MKILPQIASGAIVAALAFFAGQSSTTTTVPQGPIASVDMEKVINDFLEDNAIFENLKGEKKAKDAALEAQKEAIEALLQTLEITPRNSPEYLQLQTTIAMEQQKLKLQGQSNELSYNNSRGKVIREAYKRAYNQIEAYSKEKGIVMVVLSTKPDLPEAAYEAVSSAIIVRGLVYSVPGVDITEDIQKLMKK